MASSRAGQLYGLETLDTNIQDNKSNITRFIVLSRDPRVQVSLMCMTLRGYFKTKKGLVSSQ